MVRVGIGHDTHRTIPGGPLKLGGIEIPADFHLDGHSDADALLHAITDALLGAAGLADIGDLFPDTDPSHKGRDSASMLQAALALVRGKGYEIGNLDCIVFAQKPKLTLYKPSIRARVARILEISEEQIGIKAKTGEGVGEIGRGEIVTTQCVALLIPSSPLQSTNHGRHHGHSTPLGNPLGPSHPE